MFSRGLKDVILAGLMVLWATTNAWAAVAPIELAVHDQGEFQQVEVNTNLINYQFNTRGGVLESVFLQFKTFDTAKIELIPDVTTDEKSLFRSYPQGISFPFQLNLDEDGARYEFSLGEQTDNFVELRFSRVQDDLEIIKRYVVYNDQYYRVDFFLTLRNVGNDPLTLEDGYTLTLAPGLAEIQEPQNVYLFDDELSETIPAQYGRFGGIGFLGNNLAMFLKNETDPIGAENAIAPWLDIDARGRKLLGVQIETLNLSPGASIEHHYLLYAGRWKYLLMEQSGLEKVAGGGMFSQFLVWTIKLLDWLYARMGNYGWAIIVFTLLTRLILFPLIRQQFHAMAKMRDVQPKMTRLRERYPGLAELRKTHKDMDMGELQARARENREKLQKKMMELYQREGVNPLGGCLPSLLQFPFLIILWRTILYSSESVHFSPGFLWVDDLSQADPTFILVILTVGAMMLQTKMTPQVGAGTQNQMIMWIMPIFMGIFLKDFPAGLWVYYFLTTALQVLQQMFINWEISQKKPVPVAVESESSDEAS